MLCNDVDHSVNVIHLVDEMLLTRAQQDGLTESIKQDTQTLLKQLVNQGADIVVCTCSTIGSVAESSRFENAISLRVDRAMADVAVTSASNILILAALESTLMPTQLLIEQSAKMLSKSVSINGVKVENAWQHFENGDLPTYYQIIAKEIEKHADDCDVIVLAQASMAGAKEYCGAVSIPVLASPKLGVDAALALLNSLV